MIQDYFTKWMEALPLPKEQAANVVEVLASEWDMAQRPRVELQV